MTSGISRFKLPKRPKPPPVDRRALRLAAKSAFVEDDPGPRPLDMWEEGFSRTAAEAALSKLGFRPLGQPSIEEPRMVDPTTLGSHELGSLYAAFVAWTEYLEGAWALAEIDATEAENYYERVEAEVRLRKSGTVADKKAKSLNDPVSIEKHMRALTLRAVATLLKARFKGCERTASGLSREMTRRGLPQAE